MVDLTIEEAETIVLDACKKNKPAYVFNIILSLMMEGVDESFSPHQNVVMNELCSILNEKIRKYNMALVLNLTPEGE